MAKMQVLFLLCGAFVLSSCAGVRGTRIIPVSRCNETYKNDYAVVDSILLLNHRPKSNALVVPLVDSSSIGNGVKVLLGKYIVVLDPLFFSKQIRCGISTNSTYGNDGYIYNPKGKELLAFEDGLVVCSSANWLECSYFQGEINPKFQRIHDLLFVALISKKAYLLDGSGTALSELHVLVENSETDGDGAQYLSLRAENGADRIISFRIMTYQRDRNSRTSGWKANNGE